MTDNNKEKLEVAHICQHVDLPQKLEKIYDRLNKQDVDSVGMKADLSHIRSRIDNGMSATIRSLDDNMVALRLTMETFMVKSTADKEHLQKEVEDSIANNDKFHDKVKAAVWWLAIIGVGGGLITVVFTVAKGITANTLGVSA